MYSIGSASSPQTGQSGSRRRRTSWKLVSSASNRISRPVGRLADAEQQLERLGRLQRAHDAGQHAEHAALGARRRQLGRRRLREEAAVARALVGLEHGQLALEAEDRGVHDRDAVAQAGVVEQVARREVVGAVDDHVDALEQPVDVLRRQPLAVGDHVHVGVQLLDALPGRLRLGHADRRRRVQHLALQVRLVDDVVVHDRDRADAGRGQVQPRRRAEAAGAHEQHVRVEQLQLPGARRPRGSACGGSSARAALR